MDLYEGLELPPPKSVAAAQQQRSRTEDDSEDAATQRKRRLMTDSHSEVSEAGTKRPKPSNSESDLASILARLKTHIVVDKKFPKAAALLRTLIVEKLDHDTRSEFLTTLSELITTKGSTWSGKPEFAALISALADKASLFDANERQELALWRVASISHQQLATDDSFELARLTKEMKTQLDTTLGEADTNSRTTQLALLMPSLRTLFGRHATSWAKPMVESVLGICTRQRLRFDDKQREEVDAWTKAMQDRRHSATLVRSAATDARRNIVVIDDANASQAKPKVGRSNHPLFNQNG